VNRPALLQLFAMGAGCLAVVLLAFAGLRLAFNYWAWSGSVNYGARPPAEVFQAVTGRAVPAGVTNLRAAGRSGPLGLKHWVWMSFDADAQALREFLRDEDRLEKTPDLRLPATPMRHVESDQQAAGWDEVSGIVVPECYATSRVVPGSSFIWYATLVFDRKRGRDYIQAFGD
jgi:hypothetical protein